MEMPQWSLSLGLVKPSVYRQRVETNDSIILLIDWVYGSKKKKEPYELAWVGPAEPKQIKSALIGVEVMIPVPPPMNASYDRYIAKCDENLESSQYRGFDSLICRDSLKPLRKRKWLESRPPDLIQATFLFFQITFCYYFPVLPNPLSPLSDFPNWPTLTSLNFTSS